MPEAPAQDRTESATPRRWQEARAKGQVARSREIVGVAILGTGLLCLKLAGGGMLERMANIYRETMTLIPDFSLNARTLATGTYRLAAEVGVILLPVVVPLAVVGVGANVLQGGLVLSWDPICPKANRIDPVSGARRLVSSRALVGLLKSLFQVAIVGWVAWFTLKAAVPDLLQLADEGAREIMGFAAQLTLRLGFRVVLILTLLALADLAFERWQFAQSIRMTRQELREEYKETEGDPHVRGKIRMLQRERVRRRMLREVPRADVVVTNPIHVAVALRYEQGAMSAPRVVAKGARALAEKIRALARQHGVPVVEDPPLAWALYRTAPLGSEIPVTLYRAVAEVLALAYRLRGRIPVGGAPR